MNIILNGYQYEVSDNEFIEQPHTEYNNLRIYPKVAELERLIGLICDIGETFNNTLVTTTTKYGKFIPINCAKRIAITNTITSNSIVYIDEDTDITPHLKSIQIELPIVITSKQIYLPHQYVYNLSNSSIKIYIATNNIDTFKKEFHTYIHNTILNYDNLIHLVIMVKNAGPGFEEVLTKNLPYIDRWTILDTGSTDNTIDTINKVLVNTKKGQLIQEPFMNFRDSRNRALDLASTNCKYTLMLDDTYYIEGNLREFLETVRGDQFATSFSLLIKSGDSEYYSNRIVQTEAKLRYMFTIHEIIQQEGNINVVIPPTAATIMDVRSDSMEERTQARKEYDLSLLFDMVAEEPNNPRHLYYIAQTYSCLKNYEKAAEYFLKRATFPIQGFIQEVYDSYFELARLYNFQLNRPWSETEEIYMKAHETDPTRNDALYFIGIHHFLEGDTNTAYKYFKQAYEAGYPLHAQFSLKPTLYRYFLPKFLAALAYQHSNFKLGLDCTRTFIEHNSPSDPEFHTMQSWYNIFAQLTKAHTFTEVHALKLTKKPLICYIADGGFHPWSGSDILKNGVGGSETYIIEMARGMYNTGNYEVTVFCNCEKSEVFEGVHYLPLTQLYEFIATTKIHLCIISRFSEYVPLAIHSRIENIHLILHDLTPTGNVIPIHPKLKAIFCLTEWHKQYFLNIYPQFKDRAHVFGYGIDLEEFATTAEQDILATLDKRNPRFIYSSFPNRGLLPLLKMWSKILEKIPGATLDIYSDIDGEWVNRVAPDTMSEIKALLQNLQISRKTTRPSIRVHGWVKKSILAEAWRNADIWLYPCTFQETYCLTAMEAAASRTLIITNDLAALQNTVADRGIIVPGDANSQEWQDNAIEALQEIWSSTKKLTLLQKGERWCATKSWRQRAVDYITDYMPPEGLHYAGMYNWTHDLPTGSKAIFERVLDTFKGQNANILEIGTYAGTSLIEMLNHLPDARATAIDAWTNYNEDNIPELATIETHNIENVFKKNIEISGMNARVHAIKGDSTKVLINLIKASCQYDFIYVDGSHKCIDCYTDMTLAWSLLNSGGIMAVDDYMYNIERVNQGQHLDYPFKGVNHFLDKFKGEYRIIDIGYRVFIAKL